LQAMEDAHDEAATILKFKGRQDEYEDWLDELRREAAELVRDNPKPEQRVRCGFIWKGGIHADWIRTV
jgi:hypothetical protein